MSTTLRASQSPRYIASTCERPSSQTWKASPVALSRPAPSEAARFDRLSRVAAVNGEDMAGLAGSEGRKGKGGGAGARLRGGFRPGRPPDTKTARKRSAPGRDRDPAVKPSLQLQAPEVKNKAGTFVGPDLLVSPAPALGASFAAWRAGASARRPASKRWRPASACHPPGRPVAPAGRQAPGPIPARATGPARNPTHDRHPHTTTTASRCTPISSGTARAARTAATRTTGSPPRPV